MWRRELFTRKLPRESTAGYISEFLMNSAAMSLLPYVSTVWRHDVESGCGLRRFCCCSSALLVVWWMHEKETLREWRAHLMEQTSLGYKSLQPYTTTFQWFHMLLSLISGFIDFSIGQQCWVSGWAGLSDFTRRWSSNSESISVQWMLHSKKGFVVSTMRYVT